MKGRATMFDQTIEMTSDQQSIQNATSPDVSPRFKTAMADIGLLRQALLRDRRILIVTGLYEGKLPIYQRAHELGIKLVMLDGPDHWSKKYVASGLFESFIEVDWKDTDTYLDRALDAIRESGLTFDGVATFNEFATVLTAQIAHALGLPGNPIGSVIAARNKYETRQACVKAGLPTPRYVRITSWDDLVYAASTVGFPAVLKPVAGAASVDAYCVEDLAALLNRYQQINNTRFNGPQRDILNTNGEYMKDFAWLNGPEMILEEYLDGDEFDIDCLLSRGKLVFSSVTGEDPQPHMIETGACLPAHYPKDKQDELITLACAVLAALNFTDGVFHVEAKYTSHGPRLLEVNARLGGGTVYPMIKHVWGIDLVEHYLLTCIGISLPSSKARTPRTHLMIRELIVPYSGTVLRDDFLKHLENDPRVAWCVNHVKTGQYLCGPDRGVPESLGEIAVQGATHEEAQRALQNILETIELPVRFE
jgi:biotin carboxylase